ncbi:HAD family hydrolase [Candidatus Dependentiae bacterium]
MFKKVKPFFLIIALLLSQTCMTVNVIFDLGGVLIGANKYTIMRNVGFYSFFMYLVKLNNPFALRTRLFTIMDLMPAINKNSYGAADENGKPLPNITCDWLMGTKTTKELRTQVVEFIESNPQAFYNSSEKNLIKKLLDIMFTPEIFANGTTLLAKGLKFAKKCKKAGHKLFVLSNWDRESALLVIKKYPKLFKLFDKRNIIISGEIGMIKPDPSIYEYMLTDSNLDPKECIFFDDQEINVNSAQNCGIHAVLCQDITYKKMVNELNTFVANIEKKEIISENIIPGDKESEATTIPA